MIFKNFNSNKIFKFKRKDNSGFSLLIIRLLINTGSNDYLSHDFYFMQLEINFKIKCSKIEK